MIRQLSGTVAQQHAESIVLEVMGVGYLVRTTQAGTQFPLYEAVVLHTHLAVRETALDLYGFSTLDELEIFELLITLPKIGPKSAQQILLQADIALLKQAVHNDDPAYLSKLSGIGKKSAEKIVAGLKEKFESLPYVAPDTAHSTTANTFTNDAIDALVALGYQLPEARKVVQQLPADITNTNEAVREALKQLS